MPSPPATCASGCSPPLSGQAFAALALAGSGAQRSAPLRIDAAKRRHLYESMQERLLPVLVSYAVAQAAAGADVIQVFESVAHEVDESLYRETGRPFLMRTVRT